MEVVTGALPSVIMKLAGLAAGEYNLQKGLKGEIKFLQEELESMKAALEDISRTPAEQLPNNDKIWSRNVRELSYDIEDSIDTFMVDCHGKRLGNQHGLKKDIYWSLNLLMQPKVRHNIAKKVREIKSRVVEVHERRCRYEVNLGVDKPVTVDPRLFTQYTEMKELVGIEEARDEFINNFLTQGNNLPMKQGKIVSIVGFGGLGKTTLANAVYEKIRAQFDCCAFVSVSQTPDLKRLFKGLLNDFGKSINEEILDESRLIKVLREFLQDKRYIVVVDDIWDISVWKMIRCALPDNDVGYTIITTTRIADVAEQVGGAYKLKPLSSNNSRKLFFRRIFGNKNKDSNKEIEKCPDDELAEVSDRILKKCAGVPLAIITMASLLACKARNKLEWYEVYNSICTGMENNMDVENMRNVPIEALGSGRARCSEMLEAARRGRVTGDLELRFLDFLEKELSIIIAGLTALSPQHVDEEMVRWLRELTDRRALYLLNRALGEADLQRQNTLLRRAARFFRRRHHRYTFRFRLYAAETFYGLAEDLQRYRLLLPATSRHGLPPQAAEEGDASGLIPVDMDWFGRSPAPFDDSPYGNNPLIMLCMSMFPYGYKFDKDRLVMRWLFEGIFSFRVFFEYSSKEAEAEAKADKYFSCLVDRNVITHAAPNSRRRTNLLDEAELWQWNVHHLQYQLLATKSAEIGFAFTSATLNLLAEASATGHGNQAASRIPLPLPRRLALHHDGPNIPSVLQNIDLSQTRSLAVSGAVSIGVPLDKFVNLVVLDVEGWEKFGDEDLLRVCRSKMIFLRYLSIRNTRISKLPPEIDMLPSLKVLDASKTEVTEILFGVSEEIDLYRLDLRGTPMRQLTLPKKFWRLYDLLLGGEGMTNSTETTTRLPHDIRRFRMLRTLATVDLGEQPASFVEALGDLHNLKVLAITWYFHQSSDRDYCEALLSSIKRWRYLESLAIHCGLGCSMEFLGILSDPPGWLEKFKVTLGRFAGVPQWFHGYLSFVQITICKQGAGDLEILRDLPKLKCLILGLDFIPREAIVIGNEGFRQLQRFSIDCPVPWLTFESEAMPKLTYLQLEFRACPMDAICVPSGISNLNSLTEVALYYNVRYANSSSVKITVEEVRKEVAKCRSRTQKISLFINDTKQDDVQAVDKETENTTGAPSGPDAGAQGDVEAVDEKTTTVLDTEITEAES